MFPPSQFFLCLLRRNQMQMRALIFDKEVNICTAADAADVMNDVGAEREYNMLTLPLPTELVNAPVELYAPGGGCSS